MKKLFYFAFAAMLCCGFTACGGDDDNEGGDNIDNLIGKWTLVKEVWVEDSESGVDEYEPGEDVLCFREDGTGYEQQTYGGEKWTDQFEYEKIGNILRVFYEDEWEHFDVHIKSLTAKQLVFCEEGYDEEDGYSYKYESYFVRYE